MCMVLLNCNTFLSSVFHMLLSAINIQLQLRLHIAAPLSILMNQAILSLQQVFTTSHA